MPRLTFDLSNYRSYIKQALGDNILVTTIYNYLRTNYNFSSHIRTLFRRIKD